ncbi:glycosyltransferase family protein [Taklimakanibacter lacteus]|uniref:glycosyltransferase family protein n=1 Tax=Taklimakanibacter lacteus TaxID=2268456 RepID=UPI000E668138
MKALIYVQHLLGIGHLARVSRIASALEQAAVDVTLVSGGPPVTGFPTGQVRVVQLPPIRSRDAAFSALVDQDDQPVSAALKAQRCERLLAEFDALDPDVLIIEAFPFGRRQMRFELLPLIERAKARVRPPLIASSVRDILQENRKAGRAEETLALIKDFFDLILVHGDPGFARLEETFPRAAEIRERIAYTGLVAGASAPSPDRFDVVVSAGGGIVGQRLVATAAMVAARLAAQWPRWCIITGPHFPPGEKAALAATLPAGIRLETFRADFPGLLANARLSISQAGYNTVCDLLQARCRAVLIPFAAGGETEQSERARRLAELGLAAVVTENELTPESLAAAMAGAPSPATHKISLDGAAETARILAQRLAGRQ